MKRKKSAGQKERVEEERVIKREELKEVHREVEQTYIRFTRLTRMTAHLTRKGSRVKQ